ncbi:hypothetical protein [Brevundimonas subvibrioides]|uniref:Uncharacterized protein n=1 Tax=Brevundimonas subvibrioides (strain ATCC 15264 / DSM 4735 / LMG 14903 / NBRC 16000 / CB 81) TaxID=633149 RepID=D9QHG6_BRESC|nr:hypothetical protein [Brevundimonas subvibrioides]ADL01132.1 hypothetical protein Bresu_1821 [Brevundimonas subvibrioides ATCC 15264]
MRILTVLFALGLLGAVVIVLPMVGHDTLINAQSISPTMPALRG